jgi:hypothetical protein
VRLWHWLFWFQRASTKGAQSPAINKFGPGDVRVQYGLDAEGVRRVFQQELARIAEQKGVPIAPLRAVLEKLGAAQTAIEEIPKRLAAAADELLALRQDLQRLRDDRPELAAIRGQALALIDAVDLDAAKRAGTRRNFSPTKRASITCSSPIATPRENTPRPLLWWQRSTVMPRGNTC